MSSVPNPAPGRLRRPGVWLAMVACIGLAGLVGQRSLRRVSPGPLSGVHGNVPELAGSWDCSSCHGGIGESMAEACLECHDAIGRQLERKEGLHGLLAADLASSCARCHGEHHGPQFAPVNPRSFVQAGFADWPQFDHAKVGFVLDGSHAALGCADCHAQAEAAELPVGQWRYLGQHADCATCHADPHDGRMALRCDECHAAADWKTTRFDGHDAFLPLAGGHARADCRDCHGATTPRALEAVGRGEAPAARLCTECHASPHDADFVAHAARLAGVAAASSCVVCHAADHDSFRDPRATVTPEQHAGAPLLLAAPHAKVACAKCHDPALPEFFARYPARAVRDCRSCHADPHGGQFDDSRAGKGGCIGCHGTQQFTPHGFDRALHARTALPLNGAHRATECGECHAPVAAPAPRQFHGTPSRCDQCHLDPHAGTFAAATRRSPPPKAGECARCHGDVAFDQLTTPFDHGQMTGFALAGAHGQADCASCHPLLPQKDARGRTFERASTHFGGINGCVGCHDDAHHGVFDREGLPTIVSSRTDCARCHDETSFRAAVDDFDHAAWTGLALTDAHALACADCHEPLARPDDRGRTSAAAQGGSCADCHADPHAGQFVDAAGAGRCTPCHVATNFSDLRFQHDLHSAFPLDETHRAAACSACHPTERHADRDVVRYRPRGTDCADCHGAPQEPMRRRKGRDG